MSHLLASTDFNLNLKLNFKKAGALSPPASQRQPPQPPGGTSVMGSALIANYGNGKDDGSVLGSTRKKGRLAKTKSLSLLPSSAVSSSPRSVNMVEDADNASIHSRSSTGSTRSGMLANSDLRKLKVVMQNQANAYPSSPVSVKSRSVNSPTTSLSPSSSISENLNMAVKTPVAASLGDMVGDGCSDVSGVPPSASPRDDGASAGAKSALSHEEALYAAVSTTRTTARGLPNHRLDSAEYSKLLRAQINTKAAIQKSSCSSASSLSSFSADAVEGTASADYNYMQFVDDNYGRRKPLSSAQPMGPASDSRKYERLPLHSSSSPLLVNPGQSGFDGASSNAGDSNNLTTATSVIDKLLLTNTHSGEPRAPIKLFTTKRHDASKSQYIPPFALGEGAADEGELSQSFSKRGPGSPRSSTFTVGWTKA
jgi:hypothetical protein